MGGNPGFCKLSSQLILGANSPAIREVRKLANICERVTDRKLGTVNIPGV
jgi:hypothetical protein